MGSSPNPIETTAYLYSLWNGRFMVYEGIIRFRNPSLMSRIARFKSKTRSFTCSSDSGKIYNAVVWLPERNDDLAKKILIEYEEEMIALLRERVDNHLNKIKILKGD